MQLKKVAIVDDRTAYGQGVAQVFRAAARELGMQVVDEQFTNDKAMDFSAILTTMKAKAPDAVFYGGMDNQAGGMLRQMEQLGMAGVKFFGGDGVCTEQLPGLAGNAGTLRNVICAEGGIAVEKMPGGAAWKARYDARFPGQFQVYSPYAYDAAMVIADAMARAGSADPKVYGPALFQTDYTGVTGRIRFEPTGDLKDPEMTLFGYPAGKRKPL
jgi:branched-chain amino acid transport system substrate-binding protein